MAGYQLPPEVADFADRYWEPLNRAIRNRMRKIGVPDEMIGVKWWGEEEGALVRRHPLQFGGNIRVGLNGKPGINIDPAVLDGNAPKMGNLPSWRSASLKGRMDAVIAHEHTEVLSPPGVVRPPHSCSGKRREHSFENF
ncbi:MAG: hypothetical protein JO112_20580 [Planctomycetes bacterium]|nr:hypothetical protein [Planctomycetota bacterium]